MNITRPNPLLYVACYVIWFALCAATFVLIVNLRSNMLDVVSLTGGRQEMAGLVDRFGIILLGVLFIVVILVMEHKLRTGIEKGLLWKRALIGTAILVGTILISNALHVGALMLQAR
jgi:hypothetical protein